MIVVTGETLPQDLCETGILLFLHRSTSWASPPRRSGRVLRRPGSFQRILFAPVFSLSAECHQGLDTERVQNIL